MMLLFRSSSSAIPTALGRLTSKERIPPRAAASCGPMILNHRDHRSASSVHQSIPVQGKFVCSDLGHTRFDRYSIAAQPQSGRIILDPRLEAFRCVRLDESYDESATVPPPGQRSQTIASFPDQGSAWHTERYAARAAHCAKRKSASSSWTSTAWCGMVWAPSSSTRAPYRCAISMISRAGSVCPVRLEL